MSYSALIVGLGQIGMGYDLHLNPDRYVYSHARALTEHPQFRLLGGVDPSAKQRRLFKQHYQLPAFDDLDKALDSAAPDLVVVATATAIHLRTLQRILSKTRPKAVLCEKPLAGDAYQAREMLSLCSSRGVKLFVNYVRRSDPAVIEIKRRLAARVIKGPIKGTAWYTKGFMHNGSHHFNVLEYWLGPMTAWTRVNSRRIAKGKDAQADVLVSFKDGTVMFQAARENAFSIHAMELLMSNGQLRYESGGERVEWRGIEKHPRIAGYTVLSEHVEALVTGMDRYQWNVADQLAAALSGRPHHLCSGREAFKTLKSMQTILDAKR